MVKRAFTKCSRCGEKRVIASQIFKTCVNCTNRIYRIMAKGPKAGPFTLINYGRPTKEKMHGRSQTDS